MATHPDVVVLGGGFAGLAFARQLRMLNPQIQIAVVDRQQGPFPLATHKIGESFVEGATHWLHHTLGLKDYFDQNHLPKLGLRIFGGSSGRPLEQRFELGGVDFPPVPGLQVDRGLLENDLRAMSKTQGIDLLESATIQELTLAEDDAPHTVVIERDGISQSLRPRWVIDATGWRRMISAQQGLTRRSEHTASCCWWRVRGQLDVTDFPTDPTPVWRQRVSQRRWFSTNHILGEGYWIWFIGLSTGHTSIGIVSDERLHPLRERNTWQRALHWLTEHEPEVARAMQQTAPLDFGVMKNYAHKTRQPFGHRWACLGPAASFTDPLYSLGADLIAMGSTMAANLVDADTRGEPIDAMTGTYNRFYVDAIDDITRLYADQFRVFGNDRVTLLKILWDGVLYFAHYARVLIQGVLRNPELTAALHPTFVEITRLNAEVQALFRRWAEQAGPQSVPSGFYNPGASCSALRPLTLTPEVMAPMNPSQFIREQGEAAQLLKHLAQALSRLAATERPETQVAPTATTSPIVEQIEAQLRRYLGTPIENPACALAPKVATTTFIPQIPVQLAR